MAHETATDNSMPDAEAFDRIAETMTAHGDLTQWISGAKPDKALAAASLNAGKKKPPNLREKVGKYLTDPAGNALFSPLKIVKWEKGAKLVFTKSLTTGTLDEATRAGHAPLTETPAIFQTDLYFRSDIQATEIDIATVAAIAREAGSAILATTRRADGNMDPGSLERALNAVRIFAAGLPGGSSDGASVFVVPFGATCLVVRSYETSRTELDETTIGSLLVVESLLGADDIAGLDPSVRSHLETLAEAMTPEGNPGPDAYADLVGANAGLAARITS